MNIRALLLALFLCPIHALSDTWVPITSEIPGVQLWTFPSDAYEGDDNEFMRHCNSGKLIYVSILETPVKCQFVPPSSNYGFYRMVIKTNENRMPESQLVIVSKKPIQPRINPVPITPEELEKLKEAEKTSIQEIAQGSKRAFLVHQEGITEKHYAEYVKEIKASDTYKKYIGIRYKLPTSNGFIYISATALFVSAYIDWELVNVIYREKDGKMEQIGSFDGCIQGGFRDLNSDGTPEVLTHSCFNGESESDTYWSLTPNASQVLGH